MILLLPVAATSARSWQRSQRSPNAPDRPQERPTNCEDTGLFRDEVTLAAREVTDAQVILIAKLGTGERARSLSKRRLDRLGGMFRSWSGLATVRAEGERVLGLGRIEVYVAGRLYRVFLFERGAYRPDCTGI